jgi:hypothetical protein
MMEMEKGTGAIVCEFSPLPKKGSRVAVYL